jgi:hypothetical protein
MKVSLPYSENRRYLTGIDWMIAALDDLSRRNTGGGNTFQIVFDLKGPFDEARFRQDVEAFVQQFPALGGRPSRDWTLAPYWKIPVSGSRVPCVLESSQVDEAALHKTLEQSANKRFPNNRTHLAFRVFHVTETRHVLAVQFDHRLFDANGAEAFLELFHRWSAGEDCKARMAAVSLKEPAHLRDWMRKFEAGKQLVRMVRKFAEAKLCILPRPAPLVGRDIRFEIIRFDAGESRAIAERASREAGFLMFLPYTLAASLEALAPAFARRGAAGADFLVSVSVDLRTPETAAARLFFNHMSFLFFQVPASLVSDRKQVLSLLRTQMYEQVKSGFPKALHESSMLMRLAPVSLLSRLMLKPLRGEFASLGFTCVGKGGYPFDRFRDAELVNLIHMPLVPVPPGIGFFINQFGPRMNAVLSYVDGMLDDEDIRKFREDVRRVL